jgi:two-component system, chemotaxis family, CheB/CheR fusion protein
MRYLAGAYLPIDFFFNLLASDLHDNAIAVVLSGSSQDGMIGLRALRSSGRLAIVQSPGNCSTASRA